jgi:DNA-binding response OmpR family regulator
MVVRTGLNVNGAETRLALNTAMSDTAPEIRAIVADPSTHMAGLVTVMLHSLKIRAVEQVLDLPRLEALLARRPYDLLLIDEQLGGEAGFKTIRTLRHTADHPNRLLPIIMMAATPDAKMIAAARDAGVNEFLRKPFSAQHIGLRLDSIRKAPREFVETEVYAGPDRRRREVAGQPKRRAVDTPKTSA